jgi:small subunit ribosomal protein S5
MTSNKVEADKEKEEKSAEVMSKQESGRKDVRDAPPKFDEEGWKPKTSLGVKVKTGEINNIDYILDNRLKILEPEIVDILMPDLSVDLLLVGQSKGKFGGGQRRVFRQTQKKNTGGQQT